MTVAPAFPVAVVNQTSPAYIQAREVTDGVKFFIASAYERAQQAQHLIGTAFKMQAHYTLGYRASVDDKGKRHTAWENYCAAEFGLTRNVIIPINLRQDIVKTLTEEFGMSTREIQHALGLGSDKTVRDDLAASNQQHDEVRTDAPTGTPDPAAKPPSRTELIRRALIASGRDGMTIAEVVHHFRKQRWGHQHVSPILHRLHQDQCWASMLDEVRAGQHPYVVNDPVIVDGRPTLLGRPRKAKQEVSTD